MWQGAPPGLSSMPPPLDPTTINASDAAALRPSHAAPLHPPPDEPLSPVVADPRAGVCLVGSTDGWVVNLNAPFLAKGPEDVAAARRVARRVSERGGGRFKGVQAMALEKRAVASGGEVKEEDENNTSRLFKGDYAPARTGGVVVDAADEAVRVAAAAAAAAAEEDAAAAAAAPQTIVEVACNLLSPEDAPAEQVAREIERLALEEGLAPAGAAYRIGAAPDELVERWKREERTVAAAAASSLDG